MAKNGLIANNVRNINGIVLFDAKFKEVTLQFAAAQTWPAGAVLGRLTSNGNYVRFDTTASNGAEVPSAVLTDAVTNAIGNTPYAVLIQGELRQDDLVDEADAAIDAAAVFALRNYSIIAREVHEITFRDNN